MSLYCRCGNCKEAQKKVDAESPYVFHLICEGVERGSDQLCDFFEYKTGVKTDEERKFKPYEPY